MAIILPHTFQDGVGETASGVQVMENLNVLKAAAETLEARIAALEAVRPTLVEVNVARALFTPYKPSTTHSTIVTLGLRAGPSADAYCRVYVNGVAYGADIYLTSERLEWVTFLVPANGTWQADAELGPMNALVSTYAVLAF